MEFVNVKQSPETRRAKYQICRSFGKNSYWSIVMRDWHWQTIYRHLTSLNILENTPENEQFFNELKLNYPENPLNL
jgi:hypothetical protein